MTGPRNSISPRLIKALEDSLYSEFKGEWSRDPLTLGIYATDASHYQEIPVVVIWPKDDQEVCSAISILARHQIPVMGRGAGTSLAGQTVTSGAVLDLSRFMNKILEWNPEERWVRVQPGVVRDHLNAQAKEFGLQFAPDPATSNRATIGGMVANNSSGTRSIIYGKTIDHLLELKVAISTGEVLHLSGSSLADEHSLITDLKALIDSNSAIIKERFPEVMRRVGGYPLDYLTGDNFNPALLFCGSEGTLGIILEAKVKLVDLPAAQSVTILHFADTREALRAVKEILDYNPSAVELLDRPVLELGRNNSETKKLMHGVDPNAGALLLVEFSGENDSQVRQHASRLADQFQNNGFHHPVRVSGLDPDYHLPWELRKKGLGILMSDPSPQKPLAFVEDSCVPVEVLPDYIDDVVEICNSEGTSAIIYAHASVGVIHVRPLLDLSLAEDVSAMRRISEKVFEKVCYYNGAWSGEHGDGYARSYKNQEFFGPEIYQVFQQVKKLFDPEGLMNPGKVVNGPEMTEKLRMGPEYEVVDLAPREFLFEQSNGFASTVHLCSGVGECLKRDKGVMCPSFRATEDEEHSTRGRANALRLAMSGQIDGGLNNTRIKEALDLCLSCKACKTECPSNVDMAKLKSQVYSWDHRKNGISWRTRLFAMAPRVARRMSGGFVKPVNALMRNPIGRWVLDKFIGIEKSRPIPPFSSNPLRKYENANREVTNGRRVILFADTYSAFHEDQIGRRAIELLEKLGFRVDIFADGCCQRPSLSLGLLEKARKAGEQTVQMLLRLAGDDPVVVIEPGCASAFLDDLPDLIEDRELAGRMKDQVYLLEEFLYKYTDDTVVSGLKFKLSEGVYAFHGHCHHKALLGLEHIQEWFAKHVDGDVLWMDSGCCGMAGAFGYEKEKQAISKKIAEQSIFSKLRSFPNRKILATGFSCRHQIRDLSDTQTMHWLEALEI